MKSFVPYWDSRYLKNIDKLSKPIYKVKIEKDVYVLTRHGRVAVDIYHPDAEGKFPALLACSGYGKDLQAIDIPPQPPESLIFDHDIEAGDIKFFVKRGYVFVIMDPPGVGKSEGEFYGPYSKEEQEAVYDVIEWIARQEWCNGNVSMIGVSWFGVIQLLVAGLQPPHLKAIFPGEVPLDLYSRIYDEGILTLFHQYLEYMPNNPVLWSEKHYSREELERRIKERSEDPDIKMNPYYYRYIVAWRDKRNTWFVDILLHPVDGPFWWERSPYYVLDKINVPVYATTWWELGKFFSAFVSGAFDLFTDERLKVSKRILVLPGEARFPSFPELNFEMLRFYDYYLKGIDTGLKEEPPIKIFVEGIGKFRYEHEWPLARTKWTKYYLRIFGKLVPEPEDSENLPPDLLTHTPPSVSTRIDSLTYITEAFSTSTEITGPIALYLYASLDQDDANFICKLYDVDPSGKKEFLAKSVLRASHRALDEKRSKPWQPVHDHTKPEPCKPGEIYLFSFAFAPMARIFSPGHRIMLEITTMDPLPQIFHHKQTIQGHMPSSRPTVYRIYRDAKYQSYLLVPIIPQTPKELWIDGVELG